MLNKKQISILGCGWLGLPLAESLVEKGYNVKGSSTTQSKIVTLREKNITPFLIELPSVSKHEEFFNTDILIINIPPQTRSKDIDHHFDCIQSIIPQVKPGTKILYISATSVYPEINKKLTEEDPLDRESDRAKALWQVEDLLDEKFRESLTIIRMGGLLGYDRIPGRYFAGKEISNAHQKVNYIHRDDAIGLIEILITKSLWGDIFNGVAPMHPTRKEVFFMNSREIGFAPPVIKEDKTENAERFISSDKIVHKADYTFIYPDPRYFFYTY